MSRLAIEFPGKYIDNYGNTEYLEEQIDHPEQLYMWDGTTITYEQASPCLSDALQLLGQLRTNSAVKALDRLKNSDPNFPQFSFQIHGHLGPQLPIQPFQQIAEPNQLVYPGPPIAEIEGPGFACVTLSHTLSSNPPMKTVTPSDNAGTYNGNSLEYKGSLFVPISDDAPPPETLNGEMALRGGNSCSPTSLESVPTELSRPAIRNDQDPGFHTPDSDRLLSTVQSPKEIDHCHRSRGSKLSKASKETNTRQRSKKRKTLEAVQESKRIASEVEELRLSISSLPVANTLYELSEKDLRALLLSEGLTRDDLLEYLDRNSCIWRENGFWINDTLDPCITTNYTAEEKFCQVFRHIRTLTTRGSDQKLRLRMAETLLYLSSKSLKQRTQQDIRFQMLDNPRHHRASTLSMDHLLERSYPEIWNSVDIKAKKSLRAQLHEHLRNGSRCWQVAGTLGLGALFAGGNLLMKIIKNHSKYIMPKLDAIINYIINAHPYVVSLYHEFDDLVMQILHMKPLTAQPSRQIINDKLSLLHGSRLTPQQVAERWQLVDSIAFLRD